MNQQSIVISESYLSLLGSDSPSEGFTKYEDQASLIRLLPHDSRQLYISSHSTVSSHSRIPADRYALVGDSACSASLGHYFQQLDRQYPQIPPVTASILYKVLYRKGLIYPISRDCSEITRIYEFNRACDRPASPEPHGLQVVARKLNSAGLPCKQLSRRLILSSAGSFNYGHWLVDDLARVFVYFDHLLSLSRRIPFDGVLLPSFKSNIDKVRRRSLRWLLNMFARAYPGHSNDLRRLSIEFVNFNKTVSVEAATIISPASYHPVLMHPKGVCGLRAMADRFVNSKRVQSDSRRIFVSRRDSRQLANMAEVEALMCSMNFDIVYPEDLSYTSQVRAFAAADIVVGIMGAAMANIIFCPASASVIMLTPASWSEPFYRTLGNALDIHIVSLLGPVVAGDAGSSPAYLHLRNFSVDLSLLKYHIAKRL